MSLIEQVKRRFARPPEPVRVAVLASTDPDERVLAWGTLVRDGGGRFEVVGLTEVEPGVQARQPVVRHVLSDPGDLAAVVRRRVDETVVASQRSPLPGGGGVLLVARRIPGQPGREWTVVFDDDAQRSDPEARDVARQKLAELVAADRPD